MQIERMRDLATAAVRTLELRQAVEMLARAPTGDPRHRSAQPCDVHEVARAAFAREVQARRHRRAASVGAARALRPFDTPSALLERADVAMYADKHRSQPLTAVPDLETD